MDNYNQRLVEVDEVLKHLSQEYYDKIPTELISIIKNNMDSNYTWDYIETKPLSEQKLPKETIAILSYINMEYLLTSVQKEELENIHKKNELKTQNILYEQYNPDNIFKNKKNTTTDIELQVNNFLTNKEPNSLFNKFKNILNRMLKSIKGL